jgi:branched-chain amino acid transport system substrate-binding protein
MGKGNVAALWAALVVLPELLGCNGQSQQEVVVACVGPMTGEQAKIGKDMKDGATLCVDDWNARGGVLGKRIRLLIGDDAQDPKQANAVANKMFTQGVIIVDGHYNSSCTIPASEVYHQRGMVMITPASTNPRVTERGYRTVFRVCGRDDQQGGCGASYVARRMPQARVVVIHDKTTYGQGLADEFVKKYEELTGRKVLEYTAIVKEDQDYSAVLTNLKALKPDLIYFGGLYPQGGLLARQMRQLGLKATLMSGDGTYDPEFVKIAGSENAEGTLLTFTPDLTAVAAAQSVVEAYRTRFGDVGPYSMYSYVAMDVCLQALQIAGKPEGTAIAEVLHAQSFETFFGPLRFDEKGDVAVSPYVMWVVRDGKLVQLPTDQQ